jgi:hypothetical protein
VIADTAIVGLCAWFALAWWGSADAPRDSMIERAVVVVVAVVLWPLLVVLWNLLAIPWRLYCEQQTMIDGLRDQECQSADAAREALRELEAMRENDPVEAATADPLEKERLELERLRLLEEDKKSNRAWNRLTEIRDAMKKQADEAPTGAQFLEPGRVEGWASGTVQMIQSSVRREIWQKLIRRPIIDPPPSGVLELQAIARTIAGQLRIEHLND